ncbi:glycosyltransferase family 2 protein [Christiangramia sp. ASW11-125]|uniref:glycosyltransferase family 2 protein n=1 Tax=Christiangramia sp. ASW11-125 TaxID=3400701 RepID=UPI003AAAB0EE
MTGILKLSIVIPLYQSEDLLVELFTRLSGTLQSYSLENYEIIVIDDGSKDKTWEKVLEFYTTDLKLKAVKFSRNFGQHNAITAGLERCTGEWIIVMDCDLQDRPEEIPNLLNKAIKGYDIVLAQRLTRKDTLFKRQTSKIFYRAFAYISGLKFEPGVGNFGVYNKQVIAAILQYKENFRPFPIIVKVVGFKRIAIEVQHGRRFTGKSSYNNFGLIKGALNAIIYYSHRPIWLFLIIGLGTISFILFLLVGVYFLAFQIAVKDLVLILIFLMSILSLNASLIGVYVSRIFIESKNRPLFIIEKELI